VTKWETFVATSRGSWQCLCCCCRRKDARCVVRTPDICRRHDWKQA